MKQSIDDYIQKTRPILDAMQYEINDRLKQFERTHHAICIPEVKDGKIRITIAVDLEVVELNQ